MNEWMWFTLMTLALGLVFLTLEVLVRRERMESEWGRRVAHVMACLYAVGIYSVLSHWWFVAVAATFTVLMVASKVFNILRHLHRTRRATWGEVYLPLGLGLTAVITEEDVRAFVIAAAVLGLADVAAGVVGDLKNSLVKTWGGTLAFAAVTLAVFLVARTGVPLAVIAAVLLAGVERISPRGLDNLTLPIVTAALVLTFE